MLEKIEDGTRRLKEGRRRLEEVREGQRRFEKVRESQGKQGKVWTSIENKVEEGWIRLEKV